MPKMKTHSATKKRVKRTANGSFKVSHAQHNHLKSNKNKNTVRNNRSANYLSSSDVKRIKANLDNIK